MTERCVSCGEEIPEGRMVCHKCEIRKCAFCGKPTEGDCVCPKCERTKMYERPSLLKKIWCAIKSMFKR